MGLRGKTKKALLATVALLSGGMVYVLWRSESLLMFAWFDTLGLGHLVEVLREYAVPYSHIFPHWVHFSLPQALWLFSGIVFFNCIWDKGDVFNKMVWIIVFVATAFGFELGQCLHLVPGCFDICDTFMLVIACLSAGALVCFRCHWKRRLST